MAAASDENVRLPTTVVPKLYTLTLKVLTDLENFTFTGGVSIHVEVKSEGVKKVRCHAVDIKINAKDVSFGSIPCTDVSFDSKLETVTFSFGSALPIGKGTLNIAKYVGELNDKMKGLYRSKYQVDGKQRYMAVTQFEATDARRCLPCWDEPAVKAEFLATLIAPRGETAISNMPIAGGYPKTSPDDEGLHVWKFEKTPRMSTYLLAFVVGQFDFIEAKSQAAEYKDGRAVGDVAVRVYTPKGKTDQATFALDVAVKSLNYFTNFFEIGYPLPKLDLIAIPDFSSGAMENWGCVTYRTVCLLVDVANTALKNKQYVAIVVAHELAHQWFGNLVTMEWWTELWLNEGFASWVEYLAVDKLFPEWKVWQSFINEAHNPALGLDGLLTSHPIEVPVKHPSEIDEIFDAISYLKGASVIRMLANYLGIETFRKGLVAYLNEFKYCNATTVDLWRWLEIGGKLPEGSVKSVMANWTGKMGYPVLSVEKTEIGLKTSQQHFVSSGAKGTDTLWHIPLVYELFDGKASVVTDKRLVTKADEVLEIKETFSGALMNKGSQAYFIVKYGPKLFKELVAAIESEVMSDPVDRLSIQHNLMAIVKAGVDKNVNSKAYFDLIKAYKNESEFIVWEGILNGLASLSVLTKAAGMQSAFSKYMVELLTPVATRLGWDPIAGEKPTDKMLRAKVIPLIGMHGYEPIVTKALTAFDAFFEGKQYLETYKGKSALPADFRGGVYRIAVKERGESAFERLLDMYNKCNLQEEKVRILRALGASRDSNLIQKTLEISINFSLIRKQDMMYPIFGTVGTDEGLRATWSFLKKKWEFVLKEFKGTAMLVRLVSITGRFAFDEDRSDVEKFFAANQHPGAERKVKQCLESIGMNAAWLKRDKEAITKSLGASSRL